MDKDWFEMRDVRRRWLASAVWIPLRASRKIEEVGQFGHVGYRSQYYGLGSVAVPISRMSEGSKLKWMDIGNVHNHHGYVENGIYNPADVFQPNHGEYSGLHLVLDQAGNSLEPPQWHLHQDLVVTLGLKREGSVWVRPEEDYIEVAKLQVDDNGSPHELLFRASHLRDYLRAREMALLVATYRDRVAVLENADHLPWKDKPSEETDEQDHWRATVSEIHEGGDFFGGEWAVFHASRTDVDPDEDVPVMGPPSDANVRSEQWTRKASGRRLFRAVGELWRTEWVEPAVSSPIVRGDELPSTVYFITDAEGNKENSDALIDEGRWLWFKPEVIPALMSHRGGALKWYTRDTGEVRCSPDYGIHFGINALCLVNVYAKDVAQLPEWQRTIWAGFNVSPDGKVSQELLAAQVEAVPADTQPPEPYLREGLLYLRNLASTKLGITIFRQNEQIPQLLRQAHRFRATDKAGLFALAKDLARLTADHIDAKALQELVRPPKGEQWGSLKSLEKLLATKMGDMRAHRLMSPMFAIYELRLADAHLPSDEVASWLKLLRIDDKEPFVQQGYRMFDACVGTIYAICKELNSWSDKPNQETNQQS